jgi:hypothetical protein
MFILINLHCCQTSNLDTNLVPFSVVRAVSCLPSILDVPVHFLSIKMLGFFWPTTGPNFITSPATANGLHLESNIHSPSVGRISTLSQFNAYSEFHLLSSGKWHHAICKLLSAFQWNLIPPPSRNKMETAGSSKTLVHSTRLHSTTSQKTVILKFIVFPCLYTEQ